MLRFYRLAMVLPVLVPAGVMAGAYVFGMPISFLLSNVAVVLMASGVLGAIPYTVLALWANRWMQGKTEIEIRRKAIRAPLFMLAAFPPFVFFLTAFTSERDWLGDAFFGLLLGIPAILVLGYAYVGLVFGLRRLVVLEGD